MTIKFIHRTAGVICILWVVLALIGFPYFYQESDKHSDNVVSVMLASLATYLPFYCLYSYDQGEISVKGATATKEDNPVIFHLAIATYLVLSAVVLYSFITNKI